MSLFLRRSHFDSNAYLAVVCTLALTLGTVNACPPAKDPIAGNESHQRPEPIETAQPKTQGGLTVTLVPLPAPNKNAVHLRWQSTEAARSWVIQRVDAPANAQRQLATLRPEVTEFRDSEVAPGQSFRYEFADLEDKGNPSLSCWAKEWKRNGKTFPPRHTEIPFPFNGFTHLQEFGENCTGSRSIYLDTVPFRSLI